MLAQAIETRGATAVEPRPAASNALLDTTDIPPVAPEDLAIPMRYMIASGRGLVLLRGLCERELREIEDAVWTELAPDRTRAIAVMLRFRCLVEVFAARRLTTMLLKNGFNLIAPAIRVAAEMRLNVKWGFSPQKFLTALQDCFEQHTIVRHQLRLEETLRGGQDQGAISGAA